ncbi:MAG TPA: hypothetical protein PKL17_06000 [Pseudomonadota bacterium]|jgi:type II secretory pathway component PulM|nr:hypothetical protein [Pseudomonadota bacterium]HND09177.1 hypothetical protein [Pseudomonadota bacterium]HNF99386.1 hypothetical protein [Pseudomonadota bacterium]HNI61623.1 hypothetical protein [Pseudomonadota bacterium]HNK44313.1 hypothetical protein [Pseudomonadota bacterium]
MSSSEPTIIGKVPGFARVREFLDGLAPRERALLMTLVITVLGLGMLGGAVYLYDRIDTLEEQTDAMQRALRDIAKKRGPYLQARARAQELDRRIGTTPLQLSGFLEGLAKENSIEIRETNPRTPEPMGKKYMQQSVDLRISKVGLESLLKFMHKIETYPSNLVLVTQLNVRSRDDKHQEFEVDMTVSTYEHAPKTAAKDKKGDGKTDSPAEKEP